MMLRWAKTFVRMTMVLSLAGCTANLDARTGEAERIAHIDSLEELSIEALRNRSYGSEIQLEVQLGNASGGTEYSSAYAETGSGPYETYLASYRSDGLRLYTRIDIPNSPPPQGGYPVIVFCHGWVGIEAAPEFHFSYTPQSMYAELIDGYVDAGFVVLTPGYRGHGTVNGVAADGIEYMAAWDNATYLAPSFYAIDVLNLLSGLASIEQLEFGEFESNLAGSLDVDLGRVFLSGHSQGGDVVLATLAVAGEGSQPDIAVKGAAISDGTFASRFEQLEFYAALQGSRRSFLAGDGSWTGTAIGADGSINNEFVFGFPPDWIENPQPEAWTWQSESWPDIPVAEAVKTRTAEMYESLSEQVRTLEGVAFEAGTSGIRHDDRVRQGMAAIGGYERSHYLTEPLLLHYSDQDYYSPPAWNIDLCKSVNAAGGQCAAFLYPHNSHLMRASEREWFSPPGTTDSYRTILARDIRFFVGFDPADIDYP